MRRVAARRHSCHQAASAPPPVGIDVDVDVEGGLVVGTDGEGLSAAPVRHDRLDLLIETTSRLLGVGQLKGMAVVVAQQQRQRVILSPVPV
ncbi:hypothetical protein [Micromonospora wenchangensis]|uniref:hypothetical protein n=1 Tax=Micromonospora wenchangensis TaxID=1185415 RepID=UPI001304330D|nr:hypothetical protein [Micromonospora wenchangensis]